MFICLASSQWGLLHRLLSESGAEKLPLYDISRLLRPKLTLSASRSRRQNWTLTLFLLLLLTNAGTDQINNLFPALMFTPAWYNEDKSDGGGHTTIQLLSPNPRTRVGIRSCKGNSSRHRWQRSKSTTRIKTFQLPFSSSILFTWFYVGDKKILMTMSILVMMMIWAWNFGVFLALIKCKERAEYSLTASKQLTRRAEMDISCHQHSLTTNTRSGCSFR